MNRRVQYAAGSIALFIIIIVLILGWKKWGWFDSSSEEDETSSTQPGPPGSVTNLSIEPIDNGRSGGKSFYTTLGDSDIGLKISFTSPAQSGISGDNTLLGYIIELVDSTSGDTNYIARGNATFIKDGETFNYFNFVDVSGINKWKDDKKSNTTNSQCEIFIPTDNIAQLTDGVSYKVKIKAVNKDLGVSENATESGDFTYDACSAGDELSCGWAGNSSANPPTQSVIDTIVPTPVSDVSGTGLDFKYGISENQVCEPDGGRAANTLYKYDSSLNCVAAGCADKTYAFVTTDGVTKCQSKIIAGDPCGDGLKYYDITEDGEDTLKFICDDADFPSDKRVLEKQTPITFNGAPVKYNNSFYSDNFKLYYDESGETVEDAGSRSGPKIKFVIDGKPTTAPASPFKLYSKIFTIKPLNTSVPDDHGQLTELSRFILVDPSTEGVMSTNDINPVFQDIWYYKKYDKNKNYNEPLTDNSSRVYRARNDDRGNLIFYNEQYTSKTFTLIAGDASTDQLITDINYGYETTEVYKNIGFNEGVFDGYSRPGTASDTLCGNFGARIRSANVEDTEGNSHLYQADPLTYVKTLADCGKLCDSVANCAGFHANPSLINGKVGCTLRPKNDRNDDIVVNGSNSVYTSNVVPGNICYIRNPSNTGLTSLNAADISAFGLTAQSVADSSTIAASTPTCDTNYKLNDAGTECVMQSCEEIKGITTLDNGTFGTAPGCNITCNDNYKLNDAGDGCVMQSCEEIKGITTLDNGTFGPAPGCNITCNDNYKLNYTRTGCVMKSCGGDSPYKNTGNLRFTGNWGSCEKSGYVIKAYDRSTDSRLSVSAVSSSPSISPTIENLKIRTPDRKNVFDYTGVITLENLNSTTTLKFEPAIGKLQTYQLPNNLTNTVLLNLKIQLFNDNKLKFYVQLVMTTSSGTTYGKYITFHDIDLN